MQNQWKNWQVRIINWGYLASQPLLAYGLCNFLENSKKNSLKLKKKLSKTCKTQDNFFPKLSEKFQNSDFRQHLLRKLPTKRAKNKPAVAIFVLTFTEGLAASLHLRVDVIQRFTEPAEGGEFFANISLLLPGQDWVERPGVHRSIARVGDFAQCHVVGPAHVKLQT